MQNSENADRTIEKIEIKKQIILHKWKIISVNVFI